MVAPIRIGTEWTSDVDTIIDVRSPAEFAEDHIPGAINLPVLSDAERAKVGTIHKQISPFEARKLGASMAATQYRPAYSGKPEGSGGGMETAGLLLAGWPTIRFDGAYSG